MEKKSKKDEDKKGVCSDFSKHFGLICSMKCSIKGNNKIKPNKISIKEFSIVLQNNIGITLSVSSMYKHIKEIKNLISE